MRRQSLSIGIGCSIAVAVCLAAGPDAVAGPNLVVNGDLNRPSQKAEPVISLLEDGVRFAFSGPAHFGRVVVEGTDDFRAYEDLAVAYAALGGMHGLLVNPSGIDYPDTPGTMYVWFDLRGRVRPKHVYEYEFQILSSEKDVELKVIAPAIWVDGAPLGAEFTVKPSQFINAYSMAKGRIRTGDFRQQTGAAGVVFQLPEDMKALLMFRRIVLREVDDELMEGGSPEMPAPIRYIPIVDAIERRVQEALNRSTRLLRREEFYHKDGYFAIGGRGAGGTDPATEAQLILNTATMAAALAERTGIRSVQKSLDWLGDPDRPDELQPRGTTPVTTRLYCLARYGDPHKYVKTIARDIEWLRRAQRDDGGWSETSKEDDPENGPKIRSDNSSSAQAVEALREAYYAGKNVDRAVWRKAARYWIEAQMLDGGFGATLPNYGGLGELPTLMRTAAGEAALLATLDMALCIDGRSCDSYRADSAQLVAIGDGWTWLNANYFFEDDHGFREGIVPTLDQLRAEGNNPFAQAYYLMRLSQVIGRDELGGQPIFHTEAKRILDQFYDVASGTFAGSLELTGVGLLMLSAVDAPAVIQRLIAGGDNISVLNRDAEHIARYISRQRRRTYNWREITIDRSMEQMAKIPILYLSVEKMPDWSDDQWAKLREYCFSGGVIVVSARDEGGARQAVERKLDALFPEYQLTELPADKPIFPSRKLKNEDKQAEVKKDDDKKDEAKKDEAEKDEDEDSEEGESNETKIELKPGARPRVIGNGMKNFVFIAPDDWSCGWGRYDVEGEPGIFQFVNELLTYTTDGSRPPRTYEASPYPPSIRGSRSIRMAFLECGGQQPVYPDFHEAVNRLMQFNYRTNVERAKAGDTAAPPVLLWVTGAGTGALTDQQRNQIRQSIDTGTYVFFDVAGGDQGTAEALRAEIKKIDPKLEIRPMSLLHPVYTGNVRGTQGFDVRGMRLRRALADEQSDNVDRDKGGSGPCRLSRIMRGDDEVGVFCCVDVCSGVGNMQFTGARGPVPARARELTMNLVLRAMERRNEQRDDRRIAAER